ncbi:PD-(D/E)XK nuclease family protein [Macrococcus sp. FSL R5-0951]
MNIFKALNIFYKEDVISDFLCNCFIDSKDFLERFLNEAGIELNNMESIKVKSRMSLGKGIGVPDIIIKIKTSEKYKIILIENKLGAGEGYLQTLRYGSSEAYKIIGEKFDITNFDLCPVYLSLDSTSIPSDSKFSTLSYEIFVDSNWCLNDKSLKIIFEDFSKMLKDFYHPMLNPMQSLMTNNELDAIQKSIAWLNVIEKEFTNEDKNNFIHEYGRVGAQGRQKFLYLITKETWKSKVTFEKNMADSYFIHLDSSVNILNKEVEYLNAVEIRYETNPYTPHKHLEKLDGYQDFLDKRKNFSNLLYIELDSNSINYKKSNKKLLIAKIELN